MNQGVQILYAKNRGAALAVLASLREKGIPASLNSEKIDPKRPGLLVWTDAAYSETKSRALAYTMSNPKYRLAHVNIGNKELPTELCEHTIFAFTETGGLADLNSAEMLQLAEHFSSQNRFWPITLRWLDRLKRHPILTGLGGIAGTILIIATQMDLKVINVCSKFPETCGSFSLPGYPSRDEQRAWEKIPYRADRAQIDEYLRKYSKGYYAEQARTALNAKDEVFTPVWIADEATVPMASRVASEALSGNTGPNMRKRLLQDGATTCKIWQKVSSARGEPFRLRSSRVEAAQAGLATVTCIGEIQVQQVHTFYRIASKAP